MENVPKTLPIFKLFWGGGHASRPHLRDVSYWTANNRILAKTLLLTYIELSKSKSNFGDPEGIWVSHDQKCL